MKSLIAAILAIQSVSAMAFDHSHAQWGRFLKAYVVAGENSSAVKYNEAARQREDLDAYVKSVTSVTPKEYASFTDAEKQAFLINSYNALTVKLILDKGIPASIKDIGSFFKNTWKIKFFKFLGEESSLDHIEHELARGKYTNCRFHFAFNCASIGCPMLRAEPWLATKLNDQLEDSAKRFLQDKTRNQFHAESNTLELSKIFDWYEDDFKKDKSCGGSVQAFAAKYIPSGTKITDQSKVKYLPYDWQLNLAK